MKAIVCDIGHTIITDSILNKILIAHNKVEAVGKLYDEEKMDLSTQNTIDLFVKKMFINKINSLKGIKNNELYDICKNAQITDGFIEFMSIVCTKQIPILFIGAVPIIITEHLLSICGFDIKNFKNIFIDGSKIELVDNKINKPLTVCTPSLKSKKVISWAEQIDISLDNLMIIGDSIGDLPTMNLTKKENRFGIHIDSPTLKNIVCREILNFNHLKEIIQTQSNFQV